MDKEERQFLSALAEFNKKFGEKEFTQEEFLQNNQHGVFIRFEGITLNYNLTAFDQSKEEYLLEQKGKHQIFLKVLQEHRLERKKELWRLNSKIYALFTNPRLSQIGEEIEKTSLKISFDEMYKEAALIGKYFFEARRDEGADTDLKPILENLISSTISMYKNAEALEAVDNERLQYFKEKQSVILPRKS